MLIEDYEPDLVDLPMFMIRLTTEVEWSSEKECFDAIAKEIGSFYSIKNLNYDKESSEEDLNQTLSLSQTNCKPTDSWLIEHVLYKAFVNMLLPSSQNEQQIFYKLVDLSKLYRVFERC